MALDAFIGDDIRSIVRALQASQDSAYRETMKFLKDRGTDVEELVAYHNGYMAAIDAFLEAFPKPGEWRIKDWRGE